MWRRLLATALCFAAAGADSAPKNGPELHQPELIEPIHQLPVADDLVEVHRGEGGGGLLATIGASPADAAEDAISDAGIPALMDAPHQPAATEGPGAATAAATAATTPQRRWELTDYTGRPLNESSAALDQRCQQAVNEVLEREAAQTAPPLYSDPLQGVQLAPRNASGGAVRIVYFIGVGPRPQAHLVISRLLYALWSSVHLFLLHLDVKAVGDAVSECMRLDAVYTNVHVMRTRRLVQWGMFSMVSNYLDGIRSVLDAAKAGDLLLTTYYLLLTTYYLPLTTYYLLLTTYYLRRGQGGRARLRLLHQPERCRSLPANRRGEGPQPQPQP